MSRGNLREGLDVDMSATASTDGEHEIGRVFKHPGQQTQAC